jgi:hypothetical protein
MRVRRDVMVVTEPSIAATTEIAANFVVGWVEPFARPNALQAYPRLLGLVKNSTQPTGYAVMSS